KDNFCKDPCKDNFCKDPCKDNFCKDPCKDNFCKDPCKDNFCKDPCKDDFCKDPCKDICGDEWCEAECNVPFKKDDCKIPEPCTVDALVDKIIFKDFKSHVIENAAKVWKCIKCVNKCEVDIISKDICAHAGSKGWIATICYKVTVEYTTVWGFKHVICKTFSFDKCIPFPFTDCKCDGYGLVDFAKSKPHLVICKAECKQVKFENIDTCGIIKVCVLIEFEVIATVKKEFCLVTAKCKK
ncbi:hypothetical protein DFR58_1841, partial [Anaerobacterium chartisolvens]